ncbi:MAG: acyl-CoA dehydrogenase family protein [Deltaproteobacteria bacterium]|nr:acyl-CoA dehydrogenase family protein [Deltaproteobacteria bacterium]
MPLSFDLTEEQKALVETARGFTRDRIIPVAAKCDHDSKFPEDVYRAAWELGLVGPIVPEAYGGVGACELDHTLIVEEMAYGCSGIQTSITANSLAATPVILAGNDEQKKKYLGMLTSEPVFAAYATTEPAAGSDVAGMQTRVTKHGDDYVLDGQKCFITNASWARWYVIFATVDPAKKHRGIMGFIVDRDTPGLSIGKKEDKMGQRASDTATIILEDVKVPKKNLLADEGHGFKLAMQTFDRTRPDIGAMAVGVMRRALDECTRYALERKTFGVPIAQHQAIQFMLADMAMKIEATKLLVQKAAWMLDEGAPSSIVSAYAKAFGADSAMQVTTDAVQIFGGNGYMRDYPVEKLMRDAKILQIYEGTSQIQRIVIARNVMASSG